MADSDVLVRQFEANRDHLRAVAHRMLGSRAEAEDAVQETWLRLNRADTSDVENLTGWLTTVVGRVSLDMLRSRTSRREDAIAEEPSALVSPGQVSIDPAQDAVLVDEVGQALLFILDTLSPSERLAFVLHDLFGVPFDEIAIILDRSPKASRKLASRARGKVRGESPSEETDADRQREVVNAFLRASRAGDFDSLLQLLDPDIVVRADATAVKMGAAPELHGATAVLNTFLGRSEGAQPAMVNGIYQAAWAPRKHLVAVISFTVVGGQVVAINLTADRDQLADLDVALMQREDGE